MREFWIPILYKGSRKTSTLNLGSMKDACSINSLTAGSICLLFGSGNIAFFMLLVILQSRFSSGCLIGITKRCSISFQDQLLDIECLTRGAVFFARRFRVPIKRVVIAANLSVALDVHPSVVIATAWASLRSDLKSCFTSSYREGISLCGKVLWMEWCTWAPNN